MRKYFFRQLSTRWFDRYLTFCGVALNALAVVSVAGALLPDEKKKENQKYSRARIELENGPRCDQLMANGEFKPGQEFNLSLQDGSVMKLSYKDKGTNARTKEGHDVHMVEMDRVGFLFFEVDDKKMIRRCVPASSLDCVTADGSFDKNGECVVAIHLPSDCEVMKGTLLGNNCRVPAHSRILKPSARASGKICSTPDCADGKTETP
jgi:hypothetical protein